VYLVCDKSFSPAIQDLRMAQRDSGFECQLIHITADCANI